MFSDRLPAHAERNALTRLLDEMMARGEPYVDLTASNPTHADIPYPPGLLEPLADPEGLRYDPHPLGLPAARAAVAADHGRRGARVDPAHVVLTASTSEAYTWLFKLLCNPGDCVLVPRPSYPLFEHLTRLEGVRAEPYDLEYHGRWEIDFGSLAAVPAGARALLVVSPNNPTGSYLSAGEVERLAGICREHGLALVADEVFADYALDARQPLTDIATRAGALSFTLGGLSKAAGLPQLKLGWIVAGGPAGERDRALEALELIADSFLSVSTPVQVAAAALLERGAPIRAAIHARVAGNLAVARRLATAFPACDLLRVEGGWSLVVRIPATRSEERFVLDLLQQERILVHPG
jgi:alanine-synthesizing transaminase